MDPVVAISTPFILSCAGYPIAKIPRVEFDVPTAYKDSENVKSPKSSAFPVDAIVM